MFKLLSVELSITTSSFNVSSLGISIGSYRTGNTGIAVSFEISEAVVESDVRSIGEAVCGNINISDSDVDTSWGLSFCVGGMYLFGLQFLCVKV